MSAPPPDPRSTVPESSGHSPALVDDSRIQRALRQIPWDVFATSTRAPGGRRGVVQRVPPASSVGALIEALSPGPDDRVLHVGTGSGYADAVLSLLVREVVSIEAAPAIAEVARARLAALELGNVEVVTGDGFEGLPARAPFDGVLVTTTLREDPPRALLEQLAPGGRLVGLVGARGERQTIIRFVRRAEHEFLREQLTDVRLVSLLGDILVELGALDREAVERAARSASEEGRRLGDALRTETPLEEGDLYRALAIQRGLPFATFDGTVGRIQQGVIRSIPRPFLEHNQLVPLELQRGVLGVATCNPDASAGVLTQAIPGVRAVEIVLVTPTDYRRLWTALQLQDRPEDHQQKARVEADLLDPGDPAARYIGLFDALLLDAVSERASDIHLERYGERVRVRLRVDGEMRDLDRYALQPTELVGLVNVIKVRANMDIAERRLPQGGRIRVQVGGRGWDLRVQTQPSLHGEHAVIRLLPQDTKLLSIEDLGFPPPVAAHYRRLIDSPAGLVLVVGPTGSGKSTTLYAGLQVLARDQSRKVITVEDPIEYSIEGVQQTQVRPEIGFNFADAMRSFVRQDPDVILVGEIRDGETALEAIRASQTGHLVFSTLHCNDATDAVQRLRDLGMHPNSIASELLAVIAQRLAKRVCEGCREPDAPAPALLAEIFGPAGLPADLAPRRGKGCRRCGGHGTRGRVAVIELLPCGPAVRDAICRQSPLDELRRHARRGGLLSMRSNALRHVAEGTIALDELPKLLSAERLAPEEAEPA